MNTNLTQLYATFLQGLNIKKNLFFLAFFCASLLSLTATAQNEFITVWKTDNTPSQGASVQTSNGVQIAFPAVGTGYTIYWEEVGNPSNNSVITNVTSSGNNPKLITFPTSGTYRIKASKATGTLTGFKAGDLDGAYEGDKCKIIDIEQWGNTHWTDLGFAFQNCENVQMSATDAPDLSGVTSLEGMFMKASKFDASLGHWNISTIEDMYYLFNYSGLSCENYDATLAGWIASSLVRGNVPMGAIEVEYGMASVPRRNYLMNTMGWTFPDDATYNPSCGFDKENAFITVWNTQSQDGNSSNDMQVKFPAIGTDYSIYWENVADTTINGALIATGDHDYYNPFVINFPDQGTYRIYASKGNGELTSFLARDDAKKLIDVERWGNTRWKVLRAAFKGCENMEMSATDAPDLSEMIVHSLFRWGNTGLSHMFSGCKKFNTDISHWDVSKITDFAYMFYGAETFNQDLHIWDVSKGENFESMFKNATAFDQDLGAWNLSAAHCIEGDITGIDNPNGDDTQGNWYGGCGMDSIFDFSGMTCQNYDATIEGWATNPATPNELRVGGAGIYYGNTEHRQNLLDNKNWRFQGDTYDPECNEKPFITVWKTDNEGSSADNQIYFNGIGQNYTVEWENVNDPSITGSKVIANDNDTSVLIQFPAPGTYRLRAFNGDGNLSGLDFYEGQSSPLRNQNRKKLITVEQWGSNEWHILADAFYDCENMEMTATDTPDLSAVTHVYRMFKNCKKFNTNINHWDVSNIKDFSFMFSGAEIFNRPLDNWNVSKGEYFDYMFQRCKNFNQNISNWNVSKGVRFNYMFYYANVFNQPLNDWDVSKAKDMGSMFYGAWVFNQPLDNWVVSSCLNFSSMFAYAEAFNQNINSWDVSNAIGTGFAGMFDGAKVFNQPLDNWNVANATSFYRMFRGAEAFNQDITGWNTSKVKSFNQMFSEAKVFNQPLNIWDVSNATDFSSMFFKTEAFNQPLNNWQMDSATNLCFMFYQATSFNQNLGSWNLSQVVQPHTTTSGLVGMLSGSALSCQNYDSTLIAWANNPNTPNDLLLGAQGLNYGGGIGAHIVLTETKGWDIKHDSYSSGCDEASFITTWKTDNEGDSGDSSIYFPATGNGYSIYWEKVGNTSVNGTLVNVSSASLGPKLINFPSPGSYRIIACQGTGGLTGFRTLPVEDRTDRKKLTNVEQWGTAEWLLLDNAFAGCENMIMTATDAPDLSRVEELDQMFMRCKKFNTNINHWDVSNVTTMSGTFRETDLFNQPLNNWDVSKVTSLWSTFYRAKAFNQNINSWNVAKVENFGNTFSQAPVFNQPLDQWNVSSGIRFASMFSGAKVFNQNINSWNVSNGVNFSDMFASALAFNQPLNNWNVAKGENFGSMFSNAKAFNQNINSWNVGNGTNFYGMFRRAEAFNQPLDNWNVAKGTNFSYMFADAKVFNQNINSWNVSEGTNFSYMFMRAKAFNQPLSSWNVSSGTDFRAMFLGARDFNQALNTWDVSNGVEFASMFTTTSQFNQPLNNWNVSKATNMGQMFWGASAFDQSLGAWNLLSIVHDESQSSITGLNNMLNGSGISCENYNATLEGWANNPNTPSNLTLGATGRTYSNFEARTTLIQDKGWTIEGDRWSQDCDPDSYVTVWKTDNDDDSNTLSTYINAKGQDYFVYWEDVTDTRINGVFPHVNPTGSETGNKLSFPQPGTYRIVIPKGNGMTKLKNREDEDRKNLLEVEQWGTEHWTSLDSAFLYAKNMQMTATDAPDLSGVTSLKKMFKGCEQFNTNINHWDVSNVTNFSYMFEFAKKFNQPLDQWNMSNATDLLGMFEYAEVFNQPLNDWNVSNVKNFAHMFSSAKAFNQPLNHWDVSQGEGFSGVFRNAEKFNQNVNLWDVSKGDIFAGMFEGAKVFNQPLNKWDVGNGTIFDEMFKGAVAFNQPLDHWDVANGFAFQDMFKGATAFNQDLNNWDVSQGVYFCGMFENAISFDQSLSNWNISSAKCQEPELSSVETRLNRDGECSGLARMLNGTALSCENYNATLKGWADNPAHTVFSNNPCPIALGALGLTYGDKESRQKLIDKGLQISGDQYDPACDPNAFVTVWNTNIPVTSSQYGNNKIRFPGIGTNYTIYWEDINDPTINGTLNGTANNNQLITFPTAGTYRVKAMGLTGLDSDGAIDRLIDVEQWGNTHWTSLKKAFKSAENMEMSATDAPDLTGVNDLSDMFFRCKKFNTNINHWDVSNIETFSRMFFEAEKFNQPLDQWNVGNASIFTSMFYAAKTFNQNINTWDVSKGTQFQSMFSSATLFNQPLASWDVSKGIDFSHMFAETKAFNQPLNTWDVSKATKMPGMFSGARDFNQALDNWDVSQVSDFTAMFNNALAFNKPIGNWDVGSGTQFQFMFSRAQKFNQALEDWNMSHATNLEGMFSEASVFNQPLEAWDVSNVKLFAGMFAYASAFNQPLNNWDVSKGIAFCDMFFKAHSFNQPLPDWTFVSAGYIPIPGTAERSGSYSDGCNGLTRMLDYSALSCENYNTTLEGWANNPEHTSFVVNGTPLGFGAKGLTYGDKVSRQKLIDKGLNMTNEDQYSIACDPNCFVTVWNTNNEGASPNNKIKFPGIGTNYSIYWEDVNDPTINGTLIGNGTDATPYQNITFPTAGTYRVKATGLTGVNSLNNGDSKRLIDVEQWGNTHWASLVKAFVGCENMEMSATDAPDLSGVTSLDHMFGGCQKFNSNINHWDVGSIIDYSYMFSGAHRFNQPLGNWDVGNAIDATGMFYNAKAFNQNINSWDVSNLTDLTAMFKGAENFNQPLNSWNVGEVIGFGYMFEGATNFNQALNTWDVSKANTFRMMFKDARSFNQFIDTWDVSNATEFINMFKGASVFNQPLKHWDVSKGKYFCSMFENAYSFNQSLATWDLLAGECALPPVVEGANRVGDECCGFTKMLDNSGLSCENYNATLVGWAYNPQHTSFAGLDVGVEGLEYGGELAEDARTELQNKSLLIQGDVLSQMCAKIAPIELLSFEVSKQANQTVLLEWVSSVEINNDHYTIYRSTDGLNWEFLEEVSGMGNSIVQQSYSLVDNNPYQGANYYRLEQTDYDGTHEELGVRYVYISSSDAAGHIILSPNPTRDRIHVRGDYGDVRSLQLINVLGQNVMTQVNQQIQGKDHLLLDLSSLPAGTYILKTEHSNFKIIKK